MTTFKQVKNNAKTHVTPDGLNNLTSPVTFSVVNGEGTRFPTTGNSYWVTIYDDTTYTDPFDDPLMEIGLITVKSADTFTMTRTQLNTSAQAHTGTPAMKLLVVDQQLIDIQTAVNTLETLVGSNPLVDLSSAQALTNKDLSSATNTFPFTLVTLSGIQNVDNKVFASTNTFPTTLATVSGSQTLVYKNIQTRLGQVTVSGSITPNANTTDLLIVTDLNGAVTFMPPTGSPLHGQSLIIRIKDNGVGRALTWNTNSGGYRVIGSTLPTTTVATKTHYIGAKYNAIDNKWDVLAVGVEA